MNSKLRRLAFLPLLFACSGDAAAGGTVAVLSATGGAYMEAFSAFQAAYGSEVPYFAVSNGKPFIPPGTTTVVAFGGKAANYPYPPGISIVYCMAPGLFLKAPPAEGRSTRISLIPVFDTLFFRIREIQPGIRRLRVFWMTPSFAPLTERAKTEGARRGIEVTSVRVASLEDMPTLLRQTLDAADAFWVPPDPLLATPENLIIMREFSWGNAMPFYGSTKGMTREGAAASVGVSFKGMGASAAGAALRLARGEKLPEVVFPENSELTLNSSAAKKCRLEFEPEILRKANYLFP
jgi:hypothetical protein